MALQASLYDVPGGYRAVMFDRFQGVKDIATSEGTHFLVPWLQKAILYDVRIKPRNISTTTGSKDLQMVSLTLRVLSRPDIQHLPKIYQSLGADYDERVLPSIGNEVLKATVAQFDAAELITQREVVSARIREDLLKRAREFNIVLEDVSITHMTFGQDFTKAVEQKQIAQQDAERAKFIVEKAEQERQASVIRAEGEAEAAQTISRALEKAGDGLLTIRRIEASKDIASTLSGAKNVTYLPHGQGMLYVSSLIDSFLSVATLTDRLFLIPLFPISSTVSTCRLKVESPSLVVVKLTTSLGPSLCSSISLRQTRLPPHLTHNIPCHDDVTQAETPSKYILEMSQGRISHRTLGGGVPHALRVKPL